MVYYGKVKDGMVLSDKANALPEGAPVAICEKRPSPPKATRGRKTEPTMYDQLKDFIGIGDDLPTDFSINHDHYLYGAPKRK